MTSTTAGISPRMSRGIKPNKRRARARARNLARFARSDSEEA